jgi:apolipoprotein N-acyltransferase
VASPSTGDRGRALAAAGAGVVFASTSPPTDFTPGVLVGLVLFAWSLAGAGSKRHALARGWLFGLTANLVALRFVPEVITRFTPLPFAAGLLALVLLAAAQALPWALGGLAARGVVERAARVARARGVPAWLAFAVGVYVATFVPCIFPWTPAGGLARFPALLQIADTVGERGVSFVVAIACGLVAESFARAADWRARAAPAAVGGGIVALLLAWGTVRIAAVERARGAAPHVRVALVQPSFEASDRWEATRARMMIERLTALTKSAEARGAELVVWPESAYPYTLPHGTKRSPWGERAVLQGGVRGPVLTGAYLSTGTSGYNAAILATPDGAISKSYDKRHLLWFGETVPLGDVFPWLRRAFARGTGLAPGTDGVVFETGHIRAAVLNCYEDTLPVAGREALEMAPNLLVNVTNDAWFAGSAEGELHLRLAVLRTIETRRDLVRAVNKGPTSFVDAGGRVRARYAEALPATLPVEPALLDGPPTLYARFGDWPLGFLVAASLAARLRQREGRAARTRA